MFSSYDNCNDHKQPEYVIVWNEVGVFSVAAIDCNLCAMSFDFVDSPKRRPRSSAHSKLLEPISRPIQSEFHVQLLVLQSAGSNAESKKEWKEMLHFFSSRKRLGGNRPRRFNGEAS